eukprot:12603521-Ditylum_brightwellii.AAC.3
MMARFIACPVQHNGLNQRTPDAGEVLDSVVNESVAAVEGVTTTGSDWTSFQNWLTLPHSSWT